MQTKILLFDFDGTIADTADAAVRIYNQIARENNFRIISNDILPELRNMSAMDAVRFFNIPLFKLPFIVKKVRTVLKDEVPDLKMFAGIKEQLELLKHKDYKLFVLSTNSKENIKSFLDHNQIKEFDDIYSVSNIFGKHVKIKSLIKSNNWDRSSVIYIGDEVRDIDAAKKAGIKAAAVTWGYNSEKVLAKNNPHMLLKSPSELSLL
jgi:phosphoglycolate phosphatase-like HAD superfamily hydrolase